MIYCCIRGLNTIIKHLDMDALAYMYLWCSLSVDTS